MRGSDPYLLYHSHRCSFLFHFVLGILDLPSRRIRIGTVGGEVVRGSYQRALFIPLYVLHVHRVQFWIRDNIGSKRDTSQPSGRPLKREQKTREKH